ncbi:MAG: MBL fold metallo-hydrolase [Clostridia bacterium]|nr:MBL fold metallo-hydrolase [Clostridia bacterium]
MDIISLGSGSKGNSTLLSIGGRYILIDNGFNFREFTKRIPIDPKYLSAILLTHEHSDHLEGVGALAKEYSIPVYIPSALKPVTVEKLWGAETKPFSDGEMDVDGVKVSSFRLPHDATYTVGYKLERGEDSFAIVTDCGEFTRAIYNNIVGAKTVLIEANYDVDMLRGGAYPPMLKRRIEGRLGHLSNTDSANAVVSLAKKGVKKFILGHISENNNAPELAYDCVQKSLSENGFNIPLDFCVQNKVKNF